MKYLTTKEAADILGLKFPETVIDYIKKGYIKAHKHGRDWLVDSESVHKRKERLEKTAPLHN